tara:strand:+ start:431 stop:943 length:513 start_codon:yes stop_codon:yes gene_type:complete
MKKVTITDLNGKELEVFYADNKQAQSISHNADSCNIKIEDAPTKHWAEMTGGTKELEESYEDESSDLSFMQKLQTSFLGKVKDLEQSGSQIKIDDTIPSDFIDLSELRNGAIYKVSGLDLIAKLVNKQFERELHNPLLKMKRHGTVFYVEKGSLIKATDLEVELYLEESK